MNKIWLIIKREYITRVKTRTFLLTTFLTPIGIGLFMLVVGMIFSYKGDEKIRILVADQAGIYENKGIRSSENGMIVFQKSKEPLDELKIKVGSGEFDGVLQIPAITNIKTDNLTIFYHSDKKLSLLMRAQLEKQVSKAIRTFKIEKLNIDKEIIDNLDTNVSIDPEPISSDGANNSILSSAIGAGMGTLMGFAMFMIVMFYGSFVMKGVMEEKVNRIVEVMISSVKPFELMMGKILGIGAVGLTQLSIWIILMPVVYFLVFLFSGDVLANPQIAGGMEGIDQSEIQEMTRLIMEEMTEIPWGKIGFTFIFYFLGGYLFYASLFAALGSAIGDDISESQNLTFPVMLPIMISMYISMAIVNVPDSSLAFWASRIPFSSPIVMPARIIFSPPWWHVLLSMVLLIIGVIVVVYFAAKIYRTGILMYGKKTSFKELWKWMRN